MAKYLFVIALLLCLTFSWSLGVILGTITLLGALFSLLVKKVLKKGKMPFWVKAWEGARADYEKSKRIAAHPHCDHAGFNAHAHTHCPWCGKENSEF